VRSPTSVTQSGGFHGLLAGSVGKRWIGLLSMRQAPGPGDAEVATDEGVFMILATDWGVGEVLWTMLWFTLFFIWIWLLITVFADIFRSHDINGWVKAIWIIFIIFLPYLGVLVYLIARGHKMAEHAAQAAAAQDAAAKAYIREAAGGAPSTADELERLAKLKEQGVISDEEFNAQKAKILS
jgi:hypothetical protein